MKTQRHHSLFSFSYASLSFSLGQTLAAQTARKVPFITEKKKELLRPYFERADNKKRSCRAKSRSICA
jgi:hypothetical protein